MFGNIILMCGCFSLEILFYLFVSSTGCDEFCDVFPSRSSSICLSVALVVMNSVMFVPRDPLLSVCQ